MVTDFEDLQLAGNGVPFAKNCIQIDARMLMPLFVETTHPGRDGTGRDFRDPTRPDPTGKPHVKPAG